MSENKEKDLLLSVKNLVVEYTSDEKKVQAVNGVSFDIKRGEVLGLVGETGAGKTTIAKAILGILPDVAATVKGGEILYEGRDLLTLDKEEMRAIRGGKISMVFQDPMTALNPVMRIGNQVAEVIRFHNPKLSKKEVNEKAVEILGMVGIGPERFMEYPHQFSGGMKQRVVIAIALACNPRLLLADEPTTALDVTIQAQVLDMIRSMQEEKQTAMVLITHDLGIVAETCDNVAVVYAGEVIEYGRLEDIFDHPAHPYTVGLFGALPDIQDDSEWLHPIGGLPPDPSDLPKGCKFSPRCPHVCEDCRHGDIPVQKLGEIHTCKCLRAADARKEAVDDARN